MNSVADDDQSPAKSEMKNGLATTANQQPEPPKQHQQPKPAKHSWLEKIAVAFAGIAALGAAYQGWISDRTLKQSQRPWVMAESAKLFSPLDFTTPSVSASVEFDIKNEGVSTATDGWMFAYIEPNDATILSKHWDETCKMLDTYRRDSALSYQKSGLGNWPVGFVLAPNQSTKIQIGMGSRSLSGAAVLDSQKAGGGGFYVFGCIQYRDQFRLEHTTRTCFQPAENIRADGNVTFKICNAFQTAD